MELVEAMKENGVVRTVSPFPIPNARRPTSNAVVPEVVAMQCSVPRYAANSFSNSFTILPQAIMPESRTSITACFSSAPIKGFAILIIVYSLSELPVSREFRYYFNVYSRFIRYFPLSLMTETLKIQ